MRRDSLRFGRRLWRRFHDDNLVLVSAGVAFFGLLALFPTITAVLAIGGLVIDPVKIVAQMQSLRGVIPDDALSLLIGQAQSVARASGLHLTVLVSLGLAFWSASRGVNVLCNGLAVAYGTRDTRSFLRRNLHVLGMTVVLILGLVVMLVLMVGVPVMLSFVPLGPSAGLAVQWARWLIMGLTALSGLALLYRHGPSRAQTRWQLFSPGAVFAGLSWIAASHGFTLYATRFAHYNESFGALAGVIILMMWLWITVLAVLLGAQINAELERS